MLQKSLKNLSFSYVFCSPKHCLKISFGGCLGGCLGAILEPSWSQIEAKLGPRWSQLEAKLRPSWSLVGAKLKAFWDILGTSETCCIAKKRWKTLVFVNVFCFHHKIISCRVSSQVSWGSLGIILTPSGSQVEAKMKPSWSKIDASWSQVEAKLKPRWSKIKSKMNA